MLPSIVLFTSDRAGCEISSTRSLKGCFALTAKKKFGEKRNSVKTVKATVVLHNYLISNCNSDESYYSDSTIQREDEHGNLLTGFWEQDRSRNRLESLTQLAGNRSGTNAARVQRNLLSRNVHF